MRAAIEPVSTDPGSSFRCFWRRAEDFAFQWHFHPECELTWIVSGHGRRFVGDHLSDYRAGDLVLLGPNLPHTWQSSSASSRTKSAKDHLALVVQFRRDFLGCGFFDCPEASQLASLLGQSQRGLRFVGQTVTEATEILRSLPERSGFGRLAGLLQTLSILAKSPQTETLAGLRYRPSLAVADAQRIDAIAAYLNDHLDEEITQRDVARLVHMSPSSFNRFFRRVLGRTFIEYLHELRIGEACRLLIESDRSITQIAHQVGYANLTYFNRRFRVSKGMTAREYRKASCAEC